MLPLNTIAIQEEGNLMLSQDEYSEAKLKNEKQFERSHINCTTLCFFIHQLMNIRFLGSYKSCFYDYLCMDICFQISYIPRHGVVTSNYFRKCQSVFESGRIILYSHQQYMRFLVLRVLTSIFSCLCFTL